MTGNQHQEGSAVYYTSTFNPIQPDNIVDDQELLKHTRRTHPAGHQHSPMPFQLPSAVYMKWNKTTGSPYTSS